MKDKEHVEWSFPERLQEAMDDNFLSPEDFEEFDICSASSIQSYLSGKAVPNLRTAAAIAKFLRVSLDSLCEE